MNRAHLHKLATAHAQAYHDAAMAPLDNRNPDPARVQLRRCCYWTRITGSAKGNKSTVTIRIPKGNLVTPDVLRDLIEKVRRGDTL